LPGHVLVDEELLVRACQEKGLAPWTIKGMLTPLGRVFSLAERRNLIPENPIRRLQPEELPKGVAKDPPRVLTRDEIAALLAAAPPATSRSSASPSSPASGSRKPSAYAGSKSTSRTARSASGTS
jgi:site-specific recombinase XerD